MKRQVEVLALVVLGMALRADAGAVLELVPDQAGPYSPGQSVAVDVWIHNEEAVAIDLRLLILDFQGLRGRLFAGGEFVNSGGVTVNHVAKFSGGSWIPLDVGLPGPIFTLESCSVNPGTTLFAGGQVWNRNHWEGTVARLELGWWTEIGHDDVGRPFSLLCSNGVSGQWLYAGGYLVDFEGSGSHAIARWSGSEWSAIAGLNGAVRDMVIFDDGAGPALYVGGNFRNAAPPNSSLCLQAIAKWTGTTWVPLGGGMYPGYGEWGIHAWAVYDDGTGTALYAAGDFSDVYVPETNQYIEVNNIAKWDGTAWSPVGGGTTPNVAAPIYDLVVFDDGTGPALYAAGDFTSAGGIQVNNIARWDGISWSEVGGGITGAADAAAHTLAVLDDGAGPVLYAGGRFTYAGGIPAPNVARWDGLNWSPVGAGFDDTVYALAVHETHGDPNLVFDGIFQFDFSTLADGGGMYTVWSGLPGPLLIYNENDPIQGSVLQIPPGGSLRLGELEVVTPTTPGVYKLDVASPYGPRGGSIISRGFGGPNGPYTDWLAESGDITGDPIPFTVQAIPPPPNAEPNGVAKSRFLSFSPSPDSESVGIKVTCVSSPVASAVGQVRWVGPMATYPDVPPSTNTIQAAVLQCGFYAQVLSGVNVVHVTGEAIVPSSTFELRACTSANGPCSSSALIVNTGKWGDVIEPFGGTGQPNFSDVGAVLAKFQSQTGAISLTRSNLAPEAMTPSNAVDMLDVVDCVSAFQGHPYPYDGPHSCGP